MISGIVMASGFSRRMGENKLLINVDGQALLEKVLLEVKKSKLDKIVLVYRDEDIKVIGDRLKIDSVYNPKADLGQSESMKVGIEYASIDSDYMFIVGDQPFLNYELIDRIIDTYSINKNTIVVPHYNNKRGMPTLFSNIYREELLATVGDKGGRDVINNNIDKMIALHIDDSKIGMDIDTREDLLKYKSLDY